MKKFLIVIPIHNEGVYLPFCLKSLASQTFTNYDLVLVNDGSTDNTPDLIQQFVNENLSRSIKVLNLDQSEHQPGAKVVRTFNKGLELQPLDGYDIICKFDSDIVFPPHYLQRVADEFENNPEAGMVSGLVYVKKSVFEYELALDFKDEKKQWQFENISSKDHVRGPVKAYRKECFLAMNGLRPVLGWDNIDVMLAQMHGWKVVTLKDIWVKHLRPTAYKYKKQKAEKLGEYFYNIGLNLPLAFISSAKSAWKNRSFSEFKITIQSFLKQKHNRVLNPDEINYIRNLRWRAMLRKF